MQSKLERKVIFDLPGEIERAIVPVFVADASRRGICGSNADRRQNVFLCQANPRHVAETATGIFFDFTPPEKATR